MVIPTTQYQEESQQIAIPITIHVKFGMDIVSPRGLEDHYQSMKLDLDAHLFSHSLVYIEPNNGGNYTGRMFLVVVEMGCWRSVEDYLRPSYGADDEMAIMMQTVGYDYETIKTNDITFNDGHCQYGGTTYICSTNDGLVGYMLKNREI